MTVIMKKTISYIIAGFVALSFTACNGFLEKGPALSQSTELTLSDYAGLNKATHGAYAYLPSANWYGGTKVLESEMRSGNGMKSSVHNSNRYSTEMNWNYTADATSSLWSYAYVTISCANNVIDNLEGKDVGGVTAKDLNNLKAECLFIRALAHFDLVTTFAQPYSYSPDGPGVPYVFHTDPAGKPARNTVKEVYDNVVADLLEAESIIDPKYARAGVADSKAVVTIYAIQALLSRVYLYMQEYQKAADYATKVIDSGKFQMYTKDNYAKVWNQAKGGDEVIFEVYKDISNRANEDCSYMTFPDGAYGDCLCSTELYDLYEDGDVRKTMFVQDKDKTAGLYWTTKYSGKGVGTPDANNTVVLRLSEMYLNRAEAIAAGNITSSNGKALSFTADMDVILENRGATIAGGTPMEKVKIERRKELAWEGHYFFDKARWNDPVNRASCYDLAEKNLSIPFPDYRWALPIPQRELDVNENLVQNEKY